VGVLFAFLAVVRRDDVCLDLDFPLCHEYSFSRFLLILFSYSNLLKMKAGGSEYGYLLLHLRWIYSVIGFMWLVISLPDIFLHNIIDVEIQSLIPGSDDSDKAAGIFRNRRLLHN
jgi:hypothetical protein